MEGNFRNTLIIISAVVIAAIFIHGFITIRRNKNPYKLKTSNEKIEPVKRGFDGSGFDQDGVSQIRVVGGDSSQQNSVQQNSAQQDSAKNSQKGQHKANRQKIEPSYIPTRNTEHDRDEASAQAETFDFGVSESKNADSAAMQPSKSSVTAAQQDIGLTDIGLSSSNIDTGESSSDKGFTADMGDDITDFDYGNENSSTPKVVAEPKIEMPPLYKTPITQEKPQSKMSFNTTSESKTKPITKKEAIKRNQIELNFGEPLHESDMPSMSAIDDNAIAPASPKKKVIERPSIEPEVLAISIVMPENEVISGAALLPTLLTLGLRYGEMDIFHRHEDNAGNGEVTFSLANVVNPGTFNLDELENFSTRGVTLFMTLPNAGDPFEVFQHMLNAAKQISMEFGAQLLDDKRSVMTKQTEQHYTSKIREFERKHRIALV